MNIKYYHDFIGADDVVNRFEILQSSSTTPEIIKAAPDAFALEYLEVKKLEPVQGSQATLKLISERNFQFLDLHTDDMQKYLIKFYRAGQLYWIGYLDSELYNENLTDYAPYAVEFSGADFNILERLKFRNESEKPYTDIASFLIQLKRCFDRLGLPFQKLYIGCSTTPEGITLSSSETALHKLYIQSANFYDEDKEPMSCREVVESILQPLGLMMVQRDASVYIYDLNTIKAGGIMKCYDFSTLSYIGDTAVNVQLGDIGEIGTMSTDASLGFEEMINNTTITSSLYAGGDEIEYKVNEKSLEDLRSISDQSQYTLKTYGKCPPWASGTYLLYESKGKNNSLLGAKLNYTGNSSAVNNWSFKNGDGYTFNSGNDYYIRIKVDAYINTRENPFNDEEVENDKRTRNLSLYCNLILTDLAGNPLMYYENVWNNKGWKNIAGGSVTQNKFVLGFGSLTPSVSSGRIANQWKTNTEIILFPLGGFGISSKYEDNGDRVPLPKGSGYLKLEINYPIVSTGGLNDDGPIIYPADRVKSILINNVSLKLEDKERESLDTDDIEFKSYINKKVSADYDEVTLKCISANEERLPVGKGNILKKVGDHYELQLSYTRAGQTNILERLLMCTIHSNFTTKNKVISVDIKMTDNPALRYVTYDNVLQSDGMYVTGATLDFHNAKTTIKAVEFSADVDKLSDIPYE